MNWRFQDILGGSDFGGIVKMNDDCCAVLWRSSILQRRLQRFERE